MERALIGLLKDTEAQLVEKKQKEKDAELRIMRIVKEMEIRKRIESDCAREIAKIYYAPPDNLDSRVLKGDELESVKKACLDDFDPWLNSLIKHQIAEETLMVIDEFVKFCALLSKPENHIKKPSGQYVEKEVPLRTVADMVNEMRGELTSLPNFTAYAKIMQAENGNQAVAKHKINTPLWYELPEKWPIDVSEKNKQEIRTRTHQYYCRKQEVIEKQIREKQEAWQIDSSEKPIPSRHLDIKPEKPVKNEEASPPPPTHRR